MRFFLAYINTAEDEWQRNLEFETMTMLMAYVNEHYPDWTSYGITVLKG